MKDTLSTRELGAQAGVTPETVTRWIGQRRLPGCYKVLGRWRIPVEDAEALLGGHEHSDDVADGDEDVEEYQDPQEDAYE